MTFRHVAAILCGMSYPPNVNAALSALRSKSTSPLYAAAILRTSYPDGMPADIRAVHAACLEARKSWSGIDAALRALDGKVAA